MGVQQSVMLVVSISITVMICFLVADYLIIVVESSIQWEVIINIDMMKSVDEVEWDKKMSFVLLPYIHGRYEFNSNNNNNHNLCWKYIKGYTSSEKFTLKSCWLSQSLFWEQVVITGTIAKKIHNFLEGVATSGAMFVMWVVDSAKIETPAPKWSTISAVRRDTLAECLLRMLAYTGVLSSDRDVLKKEDSERSSLYSDRCWCNVKWSAKVRSFSFSNNQYVANDKNSATFSRKWTLMHYSKEYWVLDHC